MKHYILFAFLFLNYLSFSQIDAVKISSAKKAYENGDYKIALDALSEVSAAGQKNKMYLYYKGYSYYKLKEYDYAELYLKKYLILDMKRLEVAETLGDIDYEKKKIANKKKCILNCYKCKGTGTYKNNEICNVCHGEGERCYDCKMSNKCNRCNGSGKSNYDENRDCSYCKGSGVCSSRHQCSICKGIGLVEKEFYCNHPNCN